MKLIIAGSRKLRVSVDFIRDVLAVHKIDMGGIECVISGKEPNGIDACGEIFANAYGIPIDPHPADWDKYGKAAGPIRNAGMAKAADALLLIWDGASKGSSNMKGNMKYKTVYEVIIKASKQ